MPLVSTISILVHSSYRVEDDNLSTLSFFCLGSGSSVLITNINIKS